MSRGLKPIRSPSRAYPYSYPSRQLPMSRGLKLGVGLDRPECVPGAVKATPDE